MAFDLSQVLSQAQEVSNKADNNSGTNNGPRLVYPGLGTLKVKLLFNPKAGVVARSIRRHKIDGTSHTCLKTYGSDCPICNAIESIKAVTGTDMWKFNAKVRGLSFAQYVGSMNYDWQGKEPAVGEFILLMYPWTVYQDINRNISQAGENAIQLIATNQGRVFSITHYVEGSQQKYRCEINAFDPEFKSCSTDEEFEKLLNEAPNLNETVAPIAITPELQKEIQDCAETLNRTYLKNSIAQPSAPQNFGAPQQFVDPSSGTGYQVQNGQFVPTAPAPNYGVPQQAPVAAVVPPVQAVPTQVPPTMPVATPVAPQQPVVPQVNPQAPIANAAPSMPGAPACFGKHQGGTPECLKCVQEIACTAVTPQ